MNQQVKRPTAEEARQALAGVRRQRKRRRVALATLLLLAAVLAALLLTVARPMRLSRACGDPSLPQGALVLMNRLDRPSRIGDVTIRWEPAYSADTFYGAAERLEQEEDATGALGTVWLEVWPELVLVR
ncbi:MAG: hypothetical protein ACI4OY_05920 [Aristaeellaceae bacterium]